jgi:hypothetical protein
MNKPKYQIGDSIGKWQIENVRYSNWIVDWIYDLQIGQGRKKLSCSQKTLDEIALTLEDSKTT